MDSNDILKFWFEEIEPAKWWSKDLQEAISVGADVELDQSQRNFLYMPFMHSESLIIHDVAVELYTQNGSQYSLEFELKHRDIIQKFGRYPHRNSILGRTSTQAELEFLTQANSSF